MHKSLSENFPVEFLIWSNLVAICTDDVFGADLGIEMCEKWKDFAVFLSDLGSRPSESHTLVRMNAALGYNADNCTWYQLQLGALAA